MLSAELTPTSPRATISRRSTRVALRLVLAAFVWLGVMWLASSAGASPADGRVGSAPSVASTAADPTVSLQEGLPQALDAALVPASPVLDAVDPVVAATLRIPADLVAASAPVVEPLATSLGDVTAPVLDAVQVPALPTLPLPTLPLPTLPLPTLPLPNLPVPTAPVAAPPGATPIDAAGGATDAAPTSTDGTVAAGPSTGAASPSALDAPGPWTVDLAIEPGAGELAPSMHAPAGTTSPTPAPGPAMPRSPWPFDAPAPSTLSSGADRVSSLGVLVDTPRAPQPHVESVRTHVAAATSQPSPRPPVAPD